MYLVEQHVINKTGKDYDKLDTLCWYSKNLYNATLYRMRKHYFETGKMLWYADINKQFVCENQVDYRKLPAKVSKMTQKLVEKNYLSFLKLITMYKEGKLENRPKLPNFLDTKKGRQVVIYDKQALSFVKEGYIKLSKTDYYIKTDKGKDCVKQVRLVPKGNHIVVEVVYEVIEKQYKEGNKYEFKYGKKEYRADNIASIDLGVNNLATITSNVMRPIIINGKPLKSINQYANKLAGKYNQKGLKAQKVWDKRYQKIKTYMHKASRYITNQLVSNHIDLLIIGKNDGWKQEVSLRKKDNQNFVYIPFNMFIHQLEYKCKLVGIQVIQVEESYTSRASFKHQDTIPVYKKGVTETYKFSGYRASRGLYKHKGVSGYDNADINGSLNIMRKALNVAWNEEIYSDCVEAISVPINKVTMGENRMILY